MRKTILLFLCSILMAGILAAQDAGPKPVLVLIDIQGFYFDTTKAPLEGRFEATEKAQAVLEFFRKKGDEVVHVMHKGGGEIHEWVKPLPGEKVIVKENVSCFRDTPLLEYLNEKDINHLSGS